MRCPKDHGQQTRRRIVENASYGLRQNGAGGLSVVDLMKLADLTHGSFYAYFNSRDALVVEALALAMDRTVAHWLDLTHGLPAGGFDQRQVSWLAGHRVLLSFPDPKIQWQMSRKLAAYSCGAAAALGTSPHRIPF